ncbi:MAG: hypothetical protein AUH92_01980 [Acidobacteria bacterium 13_1_40CM_4_69_4]|nr:MAG: hypothetical protein AUH92_01980 [Acidobacteria bacterium 13_1_40CM_4_69_4]
MALLWAGVLLPGAGARAVQRDACKVIRDRYEGRTLRLRIDLRAAGRAGDANVVSLDGVGYPSERSLVLFTGLESVFLQRITSEGGSRLGLTVYRSREEADRLRASAVPQPMGANPTFGRTLAAFAQQGSTSVVLELKADKKDSPGQRQEIETLLDRVFYLKSDPTGDDLEAFVRLHTALPISRLRALTGLPDDEIRALLKGAAQPEGPPG